MPLAPYRDGMRFGQGFNSYTHEICLENAVTLKTPEAAVGKPGNSSDGSKSAGQIVSYSARFVDMLSEVVDAMGISGPMSIKDGVIGGSTNGCYIDSDIFRQADINYFIQVKVTTKTSRIEGNDFLFQSIQQPGGPPLTTESFNEIYGDTFISGFVDGGELDILVSLKVNQKANVGELRKYLEACLGNPGAKPPLLKAKSSPGTPLYELAETSIVVNSWGDGQINAEDSPWTIQSIPVVVSNFSAMVSKSPQTTYAILSSYLTLRNFRTTLPQISPQSYAKTSIYTLHLLELYMEYKGILKHLHLLSVRVRKEGIALYDADLPEWIQDLGKVGANAEKKTIDDGKEAGENKKAISNANKPNSEPHEQPYQPNIVGLERARADCRAILLHIVKEVDHIKRDPDIARKIEFHSPIISPDIFAQLIPKIDRSVKEKPKEPADGKSGQGSGLTTSKDGIDDRDPKQTSSTSSGNQPAPLSTDDGEKSRGKFEDKFKGGRHGPYRDNKDTPPLNPGPVDPSSPFARPRPSGGSGVDKPISLPYWVCYYPASEKPSMPPGQWPQSLDPQEFQRFYGNDQAESGSSERGKDWLPHDGIKINHADEVKSKQRNDKPQNHHPEWNSELKDKSRDNAHDSGQRLDPRPNKPGTSEGSSLQLDRPPTQHKLPEDSRTAPAPRLGDGLGLSTKDTSSGARTNRPLYAEDRALFDAARRSIQSLEARKSGKFALSAYCGQKSSPDDTSLTFFNDLETIPHDSARVRRVQMWWADSATIGIKTSWADPRGVRYPQEPTHGASNRNDTIVASGIMELQPDEDIVAVKIWSASKAGSARPRQVIACVRLITNHAESQDFWNQEEKYENISTVYSVRPAEGWSLRGFYGEYGREFERLGVVWGRV